MARLAEDVISIATHVGFERFHLVGVSMGGMISQHVALTIPDRLVSLTLMVTRVEGGFFKGLPTLTGIYQFLRLSTSRLPHDIIDATVDLLFPPSYLNVPCADGKTNKYHMSVGFAERARGIPMQPPHGREGQMAAIKGHGLTPEQMTALKSAKFPILAIAGDLDTLIKPVHSYNMPNHIGANLVIVEGGGHAVSQQSADQVNEVLKGHFEKAASGVPRAFPPDLMRIKSKDHPLVATKSELDADVDAMAEPAAIVASNQL